MGAIQRALASGATSTIEVPIESATGDSRPKRKKKQGGNDGIPSSPGVKRPSFADYGMLGRNGISAGAFLASPYAANATMPDIQITVYPSVRLRLRQGQVLVWACTVLACLQAPIVYLRKSYR